MSLIVESAAERAARVDELQASIARHAYEVPSLVVADAVVAFFRRGLEPLDSDNQGPSGESC